MRIGTKSFLWDCLSSRLVSGFIHSLSFWSSPPLSRLWSSTTPSPSTPPCAPTVSGENLLIPFMIFYVFLYLLMQIVWWEESPWNTRLQLLLLFIDAGLAATLGEISSSSWGKETGRSRQQLKCNGQARYQVHALHWIIRVPRWSLSATRQIFPALIVIGNMHTSYSEDNHEYLFIFLTSGVITFYLLLTV